MKHVSKEVSIIEHKGTNIKRSQVFTEKFTVLILEVADCMKREGICHVKSRGIF